jgi:hypothetical protein
VEIRQGLKPGVFMPFVARLKSCPDTKQNARSGEIFLPPWKIGCWGEVGVTR